MYCSHLLNCAFTIYESFLTVEDLISPTESSLQLISPFLISCFSSEKTAVLTALSDIKGKQDIPSANQGRRQGLSPMPGHRVWFTQKTEGVRLDACAVATWLPWALAGAWRALVLAQLWRLRSPARSDRAPFSIPQVP